jgi:putative acetyltransferase
MHIRAERREDVDGVRAVVEAAFDTAAEADLVDQLRQQVRPFLSLVAEDEDGQIVGHVAFSPVTLVGHPQVKLMGLAPMAVLPRRQRQGVGVALVPAGLLECKRLGKGGVVVLGHPEYYPRFGFAPASRFGLRCQFDVPDDVFMATELVPGYFARSLSNAAGPSATAGTVAYHSLFSDL